MSYENLLKFQTWGKLKKKKGKVVQQQGCNRYAYIVVLHYTGFEGLLLGRWLDGLYNRFENVPLGDSAGVAGGGGGGSPAVDRQMRNAVTRD